MPTDSSEDDHRAAAGEVDRLMAFLGISGVRFLDRHSGTLKPETQGSLE
jgi:hypothetical protein